MLILYAATIFLSAFMLFGIQPMFTKMVLPILGGAPSVWSVAMVFFQALLLAGYAYANLLVSGLRLGVAVAVHIAVLLAAMMSLPITIVTIGDAEPTGAEALWLLSVFAASVGLPFFALSANGPLLQAWFSRVGANGSKDPYFLYAASNAGSFLALLTYPLAVEPWLRLGEQSLLWASLYAVLGCGIAACGWVLLRRNRISASAGGGETREEDVSPRPVSWRERATWMWLAFIPSGLLVAVTAHIATDVASAPFLWVAPLALFLLTFIITFRENSFGGLQKWRALQVWGTAFVFLIMLKGTETLPMVGLHLAVFFICAVICHRALYEKRPEARRLTSFYLWMSAGGVLGGVFSGLLAPVVFSSVLEYPILLVAALWAGGGVSWRRPSGAEVSPGLVAAALLLLCGGLITATDLPPASYLFVTGVLLIVLLIVAWRRPVATVMVGACCALTVTVLADAVVSARSYRSFFGVNKVYESQDRQMRYLRHGSTIHGAARVRTADGDAVRGRPEPLTYYTREGSNAVAIEAVRQAHGGRLSRVAAVGLGSGSIACSSEMGEEWVFFEIDPVVTHIARETGLFHFMSECAGDARVVHGDARLTLQKERKPFDVIFLDAFSSDAIPAHLVTVEAIRSYLDKLAPKGALILHISNRHLDLRAIIARAAAESGLVTFAGATAPSTEGAAASVSLAIARSEADLGDLAHTWVHAPPDMKRSPWTDDYSNILEGIRDAYLGTAAPVGVVRPQNTAQKGN